jgi:hypothetical protein
MVLSLIDWSKGNWNKSWYLINISSSHWLDTSESGTGENDWRAVDWWFLGDSVRIPLLVERVVCLFVDLLSNCTFATLAKSERNLRISSSARLYYINKEEQVNKS